MPISTALVGLSAINSSFAAPPSSAETIDLLLFPPPPPSQLRHLDIGRCTLPLGSLPPASAFTKISALALWLTPQEAQDSTDVVTELFKHVETHLRALTMSGSVQLLSETSLRRLALDLLDVWDFSTLDTLSILAHPIRVLHINMTGRRNGAQPDRPPLAITILDQLLRRPIIEPSLARLEEVHISFEKPPSTGPPDYKALAEACQTRGVKIKYDLRASLGAHFETEYWRAVRERERRSGSGE